jgi:hypothetical protein
LSDWFKPNGNTCFISGNRYSERPFPGALLGSRKLTGGVGATTQTNDSEVLFQFGFTTNYGYYKVLGRKIPFCMEFLRISE